MPLKLQQDEQIGLNLTPMIDVVFLLVIFFMVATKFTEVEQNIELELPQVAAAGVSQAPIKPLTVTVLEAGVIELDGEPMSLPALTQRLLSETQQSADVEVVIHGDARCEFQHVAATLAACREARVSDIGVTVEIAAGASSTVRR